MTKGKRLALKEAGFKLGNADEFLGLTDDELRRRTMTKAEKQAFGDLLEVIFRDAGRKRAEIDDDVFACDEATRIVVALRHRVAGQDEEIAKLRTRLKSVNGASPRPIDNPRSAGTVGRRGDCSECKKFKSELFVDHSIASGDRILCRECLFGEKKDGPRAS